MTNVLQFAVFAASAFVALSLYTLLGATREGENPKIGINLLISVGSGDCFHAHHWLLYSIFACVYSALVCCVFRAFWTQHACLSSAVFGFCFGAIASGLRYSDAFEFVQTCNNDKADTKARALVR